MAHDDSEIGICQTSRKIFLYSLVWPPEGHELDPGLNYKFRVLGFFLIGGILSISLTIHVCLLKINHPEINVTEELAEVIATYGCLYMVYAFVKNQRNIALLLRDLSNFRKFGKPPGFGQQNEKINFWVKLLFNYSILAVIFYSLLKLSEKPKCKKINQLRGLKENYCGLLASFWIPFNIDYFPVFHLFFLYIAATSHLLIKMCLHISVNAFEIAQHIILRIKHLKIMILECFDDDDYGECRRKLTRCILYHVEILEFASRLDDAFFQCMFGHLILTGTICACLEKQILDKINTLGAVFHIVGWIMALFVACFGGQNFLNANEIIPAALWNSKWYRADLRLKKDVLVMLLRSQRGFRIRAGPFGILSYPLFVSVIKTSYSILCMLSS